MKFPILMLALTLVTHLAWAQGNSGKGRGRNDAESVGDKIRNTLPASEPVFTTQERTVVTNYFRGNASGLPPGLAKRDRLPPGLERQLRERGTLPPGLQKKVQPLPPELERQLTVLPTGYRRVVIGNAVILMNTKTALIYDIIRSVIP
jgi:hypothetical protein